jgi:hypothetical protein
MRRPMPGTPWLVIVLCQCGRTGQRRLNLTLLPRQPWLAYRLERPVSSIGGPQGHGHELHQWTEHAIWRWADDRDEACDSTLAL